MLRPDQNLPGADDRQSAEQDEDDRLGTRRQLMKALGHGYDPDPVGGTAGADEDADEDAVPGLAGAAPGAAGAGAPVAGSVDVTASALTMKRMTCASSTTSV